MTNKHFIIVFIPSFVLFPLFQYSVSKICHGQRSKLDFLSKYVFSHFSVKKLKILC